MTATPNPKVTLPGSGVLLHALNTSGEPVPINCDDDGNLSLASEGSGYTILLGTSGPSTVTGAAVVKATAGSLQRLVVHYTGGSASTFLQIHKASSTAGLATSTMLEPGFEVGTGTKAYALFEPSINLSCTPGIVLAFSSTQSTYTAAPAETAAVTAYGS